VNLGQIRTHHRRRYQWIGEHPAVIRIPDPFEDQFPIDDGNREEIPVAFQKVDVVEVKAIERRKHELHAPLRALPSIKRERINAAEQLSYDLFRRNYERAIEGIRFPSEYLQVTQFGGVHQSVADVVRTMPKFTLKDFRDMVA